MSIGVTLAMLMVLETNARAENAERQPEGGSAERRPDLATETAEIPLSIDMRNELGSSFRLKEARFVLDAEQVAHERAEEGRELEGTLRLVELSVSPGEHLLSVVLVYQGKNRGPFSYLEGYSYRVAAAYRFVAGSSVPVEIAVIADERPGATVPLEKKPLIRFQGRVDEIAPTVRAEGAPEQRARLR